MNPPAWMRERFPAWRQGTLHDHPPCPDCGSKKSTAFLNYPGQFVCWDCKRAWTDESCVVSRYLPNPEAA